MTKTYSSRPSEIEYLGEIDGKNAVTLRKDIVETQDGWTCEEVTIYTDYTPEEVVAHLDELYEQGAQTPQYMPVQPLADDDDPDDDNPDGDNPDDEGGNSREHSIIVAEFDDDSVYSVVTDDVWQWDYGQILQIKGLDLPTACEVDFSTSDSGDGKSYIMIGQTVDGITEVSVPDEMFARTNIRDYTVYAYVFQTDSTAGETTHRVDIPVKTRPRRLDYTYTSTSDPFGDIMKTIEESVDKALTATEQAEIALVMIENAVGNFKSVTISKEDGVTTLIITGEDGEVSTATIDDGRSAYQVAVDNGFEGTEAEWLASLKGEKGDRGESGTQITYSIDEENETIYMNIG